MTNEQYADILHSIKFLLNQNNYTDEVEEALDEAIDAVKSRKTGHWINTWIEDSGGNFLYVCSNCHHSDAQAQSVDVKYCWYCGAKMEGRV